MNRLLAVTTAIACGCGRGDGVKDEALGNLVLDRKASTTIDLETAVKEPAELSRALALPHTAVLAALGPHALTIDTRTVVEEGGKPTSDLADHAELEVGQAGTFHGLYTNTADYGREATYTGTSGALFLRPRYQKWHRRAPESKDEPAQIRDGYFAALAATWDLVAPAAELTDRGAATVAGRAGRKIAVRLAPTVREIPRETLSQRRWRESRTISALDGEITLDADKGVPLAAKLTGVVAFSREGRRFAMKISLDATITKLGAATIAAPAETEVIATPTRRGEVDERDYLLNGIAPPIKKNKDGTAAKPTLAPPGTGSGSAAPGAGSGSAKPEDKKSDKKSDKKKTDKKSEDKKSGDRKSDEKSDVKSDDKKPVKKNSDDQEKPAP